MKSKNKRNIVLIVILSMVRIACDIICLKYIKYFLTFILMIYSFIMMFFVFIVVMIYDFAFMYSYPNPEIKHGEYPFEIVYSVDGQVFEKNGVIICDFSKTIDMVNGEKIKITERFDSKFDKNFLCEKEYPLYLDCGDANYYLLCEKPYEGYIPGKYIYCVYCGEKKKYTLEEAKEQFGIEIINATFSSPTTINLYNPKSTAVKLCMITVSFFTLILLVRLCRRTKCGLYTDSKRRIRT